MTGCWLRRLIDFGSNSLSMASVLSKRTAEGMYVMLVLFALMPGDVAFGAQTAAPKTAPTLKWRDPVVRYCRTDDDANLGSIRVGGTLVIENGGRHPLLLLNRTPEQRNIRIVPVQLNPSDQRGYGVAGLASVSAKARENPNYGKADFMRLRPNGRVEQRFSTGFFFRKPGNKTGSGLPPDGDYRVSFQVSFWPDTEEKAIAIAKALGKVPIWTWFLWTEPIRIEVRSASPAEVCP